jgi:carbon starvation protein
MSLPVLALAVIIFLSLGYGTYGRWVARQFRLDPAAVTPAVRREDGEDFVPTRPFYLFGQHFSAIAAAGPIAGPIMAGQQFGWLPCLLWIVFGVIFIGAVHDMSTLVASLRHDARSIAEVVRTYLGPQAWLALMGFIWLALIYVIVAFCDITAQTFVSGDAEVTGLDLTFNPGGAVAFASTVYLTLAVIMGLVVRFLRPPLWLTTLLFVPATLAVVWLGTRYSTLLVLPFASPTKIWGVLILVYCLVASLTPVWALLQPRGYLGGFVLYSAVGAGTIGMLFGGFAIQAPAFTGFQAPGPTGLLFPFLFVTIACGACSGFHGLVCSGTTSKQVARENHCHPVGYGAMLLEGFVAVLALATLMIAAPEGLAGKAPGAIYGEGLGRFLGVLIGDEHVLFATTFGAMAFSTFIFDTLDVSTRLGRYILQELFGWRGRAGAFAATFVTCAVPAGFVLLSGPGAYKLFWTLFGTSNQLLAGLSLLGISVWLRRSGRRSAFTLIPMVFVLLVTLTSLGLQVVTAFSGTGSLGLVNGIVSLLLIALAGALLVIALPQLRGEIAPAAGTGSATRT